MDAMEQLYGTFYTMIQANSIFFYLCRQQDMNTPFTYDFIEAQQEAIRTESNFWAAHHVYVQERIRQKLANMDRSQVSNVNQVNDFV